MVGGDGEALAEVEAVRGFALDTGVEVELAAVVGGGLLFEPVEEELTVAGGAGLLIGIEIVDVEDAAAVEHLHESVTGDGADFAVFEHGGEVVAVGLHHAADSGEIGVRGDGGAELAHDVAGLEDLFVGEGLEDGDVVRHVTCDWRVRRRVCLCP